MRHTRTFVAVVCAVLALVATDRTSAQITSDTLTIRQIQEIHPDSLAAKKYNSPYTGDTVTVTGVVVAAPRISPGGPMLFALGNAATIYIADPAGGPWTGLNLRASDTVASAGTLITAVDTGYVIRVTGVVTQYFTTTQFDIGKIASWNADVQVEILDQLPSRPAPNQIQISNLVAGDPLTGTAEGQQWEGAYVSIKNASVGTLSTNPSTGRHTWTITDGNGNSIGCTIRACTSAVARRA
jgi:predicted extracellular nuclease